MRRERGERALTDSLARHMKSHVTMGGHDFESWVPVSVQREVAFRRILLRHAKEGHPSAVRLLWSLYQCRLVPVEDRDSIGKV